MIIVNDCLLKREDQETEMRLTRTAVASSCTGTGRKDRKHAKILIPYSLKSYRF